MAPIKKTRSPIKSKNLERAAATLDEILQMHETVATLRGMVVTLSNTVGEFDKKKANTKYVEESLECVNNNLNQIDKSLKALAKTLDNVVPAAQKRIDEVRVVLEDKIKSRAQSEEKVLSALVKGVILGLETNQDFHRRLLASISTNGFMKKLSEEAAAALAEPGEFQNVVLQEIAKVAHEMARGIKVVVSEVDDERQEHNRKIIYTDEFVAPGEGKDSRA